MKLPGRNTGHDLKQFLLSQYFYDGLKITFGVVMPSVICYPYGLIETGITISLGALYVSITDNPGPVLHKRNAMLASNLFIFLTALLVGFTNHNTYLLAADIVVLCFFFSMFNVYGARASAVGVAALLTLIIGIDQRLDAWQTFLHALCLLTGGIWYMLLSLLMNRALPYRPAEQTLGECMEAIAEYIRIKAGFYDTKTDQAKNLDKLIHQQTLVHQQLENVREILFKTRKLLKDPSAQSNRLLMTFIDLVDLYEQTTESHDDYSRIRQTFANKDILEHYRDIILNMARELEQAAEAIHNHEDLEEKPGTQLLLDHARLQLDQLEQEGINTVTLRKIFINLKNVSQRIEQIYGYQQQAITLSAERRKNLPQFVTHQSFQFRQLLRNLSFRSAIFRHSLRMSLICLAAFLFARYYYTGHHSYWILLTIIVILKPGFSQTRQRNIERIIGTLAGGFLGILILYFIKDVSTRFWLLLLFMLLCYSFIRIRYVVSVFFMTPFILIMFSFIGHNNDMMILKERIIDTFIGAGIAALASYFIFPTWESAHIRQMMGDVLVGCFQYLKAAVVFTDEANIQHEYRLERKKMYVSLSNLTSALQRMLNEPKRKRQHVNETNKFILLGNMYASVTAALAQKRREGSEWNENEAKELRKTFHQLKEAYEQLMEQPFPVTEPVLETKVQTGTPPDPLLSQLVQTAADLKKLCTQIYVRPEPDLTSRLTSARQGS